MRIRVHRPENALIRASPSDWNTGNNWGNARDRRWRRASAFWVAYDPGTIRNKALEARCEPHALRGHFALAMAWHRRRFPSLTSNTSLSLIIDALSPREPGGVIDFVPKLPGVAPDADEPIDSSRRCAGVRAGRRFRARRRDPLAQIDPPAGGAENCNALPSLKKRAQGR